MANVRRVLETIAYQLPLLSILLIPIIDRMVKVNLQTVTSDIPPQDVITKDNVTVRVNAVVFFQVFDPVKAVVEVQNYLFATSQRAQTTLRAVLSKVELDQILGERDRLNTDLQQIIDDLTDPWGIKVGAVEIKDVDLPVEMQRAMAKQAEAEREKRAKVINARGELQASAPAVAMGLLRDEALPEPVMELVHQVRRDGQVRE